MSRLKVLLIEDNEPLRTLYKEIFHHNGFEVLEAGDGQFGVDVALMKKPDVIILDLMLPRQGGIGALRVMRTLPETKQIPVFILTALPNPEYQAIVKNWVQGFYLKTKIKPQELIDKVKSCLQGR